MENGTPIDETLLHRHADGDLSPAETAEVEALLAESEHARAQYDGILRIRQMMGAAGEEMASGLDSNALFAAIEAGLQSDAIGESRSRSAAETEAQPGPLGAIWAALTGGKAWVPAAGMVAAMTAVLLTIYSPDQAGVVSGGLPDGQATIGETDDLAKDTPATDTAEPAADDDAEAARPAQAEAHSEVVQVDFGHGSGTVFAIPLDDGSSTPVIWINDDE